MTWNPSNHSAAFRDPSPSHPRSFMPSVALHWPFLICHHVRDGFVRSILKRVLPRRRYLDLRMKRSLPFSGFLAVFLTANRSGRLARQTRESSLRCFRASAFSCYESLADTRAVPFSLPSRSDIPPTIPFSPSFHINYYTLLSCHSLRVLPSLKSLIRQC